ncbi:hypothetical protein QEN19_000474 [Hanseniaspora menglaensis]
MEVTNADVLNHRGYLLSLSLRCLSIYKEEKMKKHYAQQLFIEEDPFNADFFNPFGKTPIMLNKMNIITHVTDKIGETRINKQGELIGRKPIIQTKISANGNHICDPNELSALLDIPITHLENNFNLIKEDGWFLFRFCYMTFGSALIYKGIRLKDDYYEEKFSKENFVGIGYRSHRIPDDIYKKSLLVFGTGTSFEKEIIEDETEPLKKEKVDENDYILGSLPLQNKILKYINKTQLLALKSNGLDNEPIYKAWEKYTLLNGNADLKGLNIGNIWRLDNMLNLQDTDISSTETIDSVYYLPDDFENSQNDINQLKENILSLTSKDIINLQNQHSVLKTSHELNQAVKKRKYKVKKINKASNLSYYNPHGDKKKNISNQFMHEELGITKPEKVQQFVKNIIVKNDKNLVSLLNEKNTNQEDNHFWKVVTNSYDDNKRLQNIEVDFEIPNKNVFSWFDFIENETR